MTVDSRHPETLVLHAGYRSDETTNAVAVPIYQTTSFQFDSTEHAENLFALKEFGNIYSRIMNPTNDALEQRIAALEGGVAALSVASGQAATMYAVTNLCRAGDNFVSSTDIYGGTWNLFANTLKDLGIEVRFVDPSDPENFRRVTDEKTRCYYAETLPNPKLNVFPIKEVADIGRAEGVPLIMDNTACPIICRPFDHGAAVVMYSTTKYIGGPGPLVWGLIGFGGDFVSGAPKGSLPAPHETPPSSPRPGWGGAGKPRG
nr:PLP-dependent transferase [Alphaproteobacteria bacterium]